MTFFLLITIFAEPAVPARRGGGVGEEGAGEEGAERERHVQIVKMECQGKRPRSSVR